MRRQRSAASGFNSALERARHDLVVFVQQDIYLPRGWDSLFVRRFEDAERRFPSMGVAGLFGLTYRDGTVKHIGRAVDRDRLLDMPTELPAIVDGLDEILLAVRRGTPLRFDPGLGFHVYGTDICLAARDKDMTSVVLDAPCFHNSLFAHLAPGFHGSREALLEKWGTVRPLYNNMGRLDTMQAVPPPRSWVEVQEETLARHAANLATASEESAQARRELESARQRIKRMEASKYWRLRLAVNRVLRRAR